MYRNRKMTSAGMGLWLLLGIGVGAAACFGVCGMPTQRKVRRRLMNAADAVNNAVSEAIDSMYSAMK